MSESAVRVRWNDEEKTLVAQEMARLLRADASLPLLQAVRQAMENCPTVRNRDIKAWSVVQPVLEDKLALAQSQVTLPAEPPVATLSSQALPQAGNSTATTPLASQPEPGPFETAPPVLEPSAEARPARIATEPSEAEVVGTAVHTVLEATAANDALLPRNTLAEALPLPTATQAAPALQVSASAAAMQLEAAMLAALQSPELENALVNLFGRAMSKAMAKAQQEAAEPAGATTETPIARQDARVLLAGFAGPQAKTLEETLRQTFDVRVWRPGQSTQLFQTLAGMCSIAVIPDGADDDVDDALQRFELQIVRHEGSADRLAERLESVMQ